MDDCSGVSDFQEHAVVRSRRRIREQMPQLAAKLFPILLTGIRDYKKRLLQS